MIHLPTPLSELDPDFISYFGKPAGLWVPISNSEPEAKARDFSGNGNIGIFNGGVITINNDLSGFNTVWKSDGIIGSGISTVSSVIGPCSILCVLKIISPGNFSYAVGTTNNFAGLRITSGTTISLCDGIVDIIGGVLGNNFRCILGILDGINGSIYVDGIQTGIHASTLTGWNNLILYSRSLSFTTPLNCSIACAALFSGAFSSAQAFSLYSSLFYGEPYKLFKSSIFNEYYPFASPSNIPLALTSKSFIFSSSYGRQSISKQLSSQAISQSKNIGNYTIQTVTKFELLSMRRYSSQYFVQSGSIEDVGQ